MNIKFVTGEDGDWIDVYINNKHHYGGHSLDIDSPNSIEILKMLGADVERIYLTQEAMEEYCRSPVWPPKGFDPEDLGND